MTQKYICNRSGCKKICESCPHSIAHENKNKCSEWSECFSNSDSDEILKVRCIKVKKWQYITKL